MIKVNLRFYLNLGKTLKTIAFYSFKTIWVQNEIY